VSASFSVEMIENSTAKKRFDIPREIYVCAIVEFLTTFGNAITSVPATRLIEGAVCQRYYGTGFSIAERLCKSEKVQSDLAYLLGGYSSLTSLPGLFLAIPYGILSEHVDRRLILLVNSLSSVLQNIFLVIICKGCLLKMGYIYTDGLIDRYNAKVEFEIDMALWFL
jgi:PCFT/HCP family folate transporter-like MFS transporter 1/3